MFPSPSLTLKGFQPLVLAFCERWRPEFDFCNPVCVLLFPLLKNWWHMHWVFVSVCDPDVNRADSFEFSSPLHLPLPWIHQTSAICVCLENIWTKKRRNVQVFLDTSVMNIYALFLFRAIKWVYMFEQFSVPLLFLVFSLVVNSVYNLFEVSAIDFLFLLCVTYWSFLWQYCEFKRSANMRLLYYNIKKN